jgi:ferrochelatase
MIIPHLLMHGCRLLKTSISEYDKVIFSYHGLPNSQVDKVYQDNQCDGKNCEHEINEDNHYCYKATVYETSNYC